MRSIGGALICWIFPADCSICGSRLRHAARVPVCEVCLQSPQALDPAGSCPRCGKARAEAHGTNAICLACEGDPPAYDSARSWTLYEGAGREWIHLLKYAGIRPMAGRMAARLDGLARAIVPAPNLVAAIPLTPQRLRRRGFNQSAAIARDLAGHLGLRFDPGALLRPRDATAQAGLDAQQREQNVRGAFHASKLVRGARVLLVDDVLTTGATARAAAAALKHAGALRVDLITVARADLYGGATARADARETWA